MILYKTKSHLQKNYTQTLASHSSSSHAEPSSLKTNSKSPKAAIVLPVHFPDCAARIARYRYQPPHSSESKDPEYDRTFPSLKD
jgi:hypothetical protein